MIPADYQPEGAPFAGRRTIDPRRDLPTWEPGEGIAALVARYERAGIVLLREVTSALQLRELASGLGCVYLHPHAEASGLTHVTCGAAAADRRDAAARNELGLTNTALTPHTDRCAMAVPPELMAFWIEAQSAVGGVSTFVDGHRIVEELSSHDPESIHALTRPTSVVFKSEQGLQEGSILTLGRDRFLLRFRFDHMVYLAPDVAAIMPRFIALVRELTIKLPLATGDGYLLNNHRWLHGRTHFVGTRSAYRLLLSRAG